MMSEMHWRTRAILPARVLVLKQKFKRCSHSRFVPTRDSNSAGANRFWEPTEVRADNRAAASNSFNRYKAKPLCTARRDSHDTMPSNQSAKLRARFFSKKSDLCPELKRFHTRKNSLTFRALPYNRQPRSEAFFVELLQYIDQIHDPFVRYKAANEYDVEIPDHIAVLSENIAAISIWDHD